MIAVVIPVCFLLLVVLWKKFPLIGGNINAALLLTGVLTLILGAVSDPADWIAAWIDGLNRMAWIMALSITGGIFAEISVQLGTVDTIIGALTAKFRSHPRILVVCIIATLVLAGSLLGDAIAASTVVGILTEGAFARDPLYNCLQKRPVKVQRHYPYLVFHLPLLNANRQLPSRPMASLISSHISFLARTMEGDPS